jgi:hypothetical protein
MPLLSYFAAAGSVLVGLLFVSDAALSDRKVTISSDFKGLSERLQPRAPALVAEPAPEPDMTSAAVKLAAADVAAQPAVAKEPAVAAEPAAAAPAKPRHVARKRSKPHDEWGQGWGQDRFGQGRFGHDAYARGHQRDAFAWSSSNRSTGWSANNRSNRAEPWRW